MCYYDFNEVDRNLVNAFKDIFSNLKNVQELDNWNIENWSFSEDNLTEIHKLILMIFIVGSMIGI